MSELRLILTFIGSFGYSGFFPVAPASFASFVFILLFLLVPGGELLANPYVLVITLLISVPVSSYMEKLYGRDARCIVIDEVVGMQLILVGAKAGTGAVFLGWFLFRVFDVLKPFPAAASQKLPGGFGVVADDVFAAAYARIALLLVALIFPDAGSFGF